MCHLQAKPGLDCMINQRLVIEYHWPARNVHGAASSALQNQKAVTFDFELRSCAASFTVPVPVYRLASRTAPPHKPSLCD